MGQTVLPPVPGLSYKREVFKASSTFTLPMTAQNKFDAVLIGGGGGGGRSRYTTSNNWGFGGGGSFVYVQDVYCTNGTTLTITIGAGGAGATQSPSTFYASGGTASTITGIAGNGVSTSITSNGGSAGRHINANSNGDYSAGYAPTSNFKLANGGTSSDKFTAVTHGFGSFHKASGASRYGVTRSLFNMRNTIYPGGLGSLALMNTEGNTTGGPIPLLGSYLHAAVGGTGTTGTVAGNPGTANTFIGGGGGASNNGYQTSGSGGGGGAGGLSTTGGTLGGTGGAGAVNSGGGGGAGGKNTVTIGNTGIGGAGGSGLIIIGYWG
jgi:hypothetical protein